jgi:hypothetical protein
MPADLNSATSPRHTSDLLCLINNEYGGCADAAFRSVSAPIRTWISAVGLRVDCRCKRCNPMIRLFPGVHVHNNVLVALLIGSVLLHLFR